MFAYRFPLEMVFRILDIVFAEGYDAVLRLSLALIQRNETAILDAMEFEGCVDFLQNGLFDAYIGNIDSLIYDASQIKIPKSRLDKLAEEHVEMVRKTSQDFVDACNLRNENYRLADRLKILEADYEVLTKEHVAMANAKIEAQLALERSLERNEELEITLSGLKEILSDDRKSAEYQVKVEMDMLAQKNVDLIGKNALLEEEIVGLQEQLVEMRVQVEDAETSRNEIVNKLDALKKAFQ